jgi:hypothetical protein
MGTRRIARVGAIVLAATGIGAAASGCGSSSVSKDVSNTVDPVAQAATTSSNAKGFQMTMSMRMSSGALPQAINLLGHGSFTPAQKLGQLSFTMKLPGAAAQALGSNVTFQEILNGTTIYMKMPAAITSKLPGGKPWLKLDLKQLGATAGLGSLGSLTGNPTTSDPAQMLQYLRAESGGITKVGTATVAGVPTTEYKATIQLDKYPNLLPANQRAAAKQAIQQLETMTKLHSIPMNVWIDNQHLVRQIAMAFNEQIPTGGTITAQITMQLSHYGPQPAPTLPPANQVTDLGALLSASGLQSGTSSGSTTATP